MHGVYAGREPERRSHRTGAGSTPADAHEAGRHDRSGGTRTFGGYQTQVHRAEASSSSSERGVGRIRRSSSASIIRREITVGGRPLPADDRALIAGARSRVIGQLSTWADNTSSGDAALKKRVKGLKKDTKLQKAIDDELARLFRDVYDTKSYVDQHDLERQAEQDIILYLLQLPELQGTAQQIDQYKTPKPGTGQLGPGAAKRGFRIYRTLKASEWEASNDGTAIAHMLHGHGGALGQAAHYFQKSKQHHAKRGADPTTLDDVLIEFCFDGKSEQDFVDHQRISKGGEGAGTSGNKVGAKSEDNDLFRTGDIFSIDLGANKDLILRLAPAVRVIAWARPRLG